MEASHQRHATQMYAEMSGQSVRKGLMRTKWISKGFPPVAIFTYDSHSYSMLGMLRFSYSIPSFQTDIYEISPSMASNTKKMSLFQIKIVIQQSRPFRMRKPQHHADFFRLLAKILYYMVSGNSHLRYLVAEKCNKYFLAVARGKKPKKNENCCAVCRV